MGFAKRIREWCYPGQWYASTAGTAVAHLAVTGVLVGLVMGSSCGADRAPLLPASDSAIAEPVGAQRVARLVHVTDTHAIDTESPARFAGAQVVIPSAWRAWESSSTQLLDGIVRTANRIHASGQTIDFLLHTGDSCENAQSNELGWFKAIMDGVPFRPLSGPDDRDPQTLPPAELDPYAPFQPQGLYRTGVHGPLASVPWYAAVGNHDTFALGVFPIITTPDGSRVAPLPLQGRPGLLLPIELDPTGSLTHGPVTPAQPGPPPLLELPTYVTPVSERRYFSKQEFLQTMFETATGPAGHGFAGPGGASWYSVSPVPGLRLITLDTADARGTLPGLPYDLGSISAEQRDFLQAELDAAQGRGEWVIVATHHPSGLLEVLYGSALSPEEFRRLLNQYPNVILHLAGHNHRNRVFDRGGYVEIETCSTIDWPQEARVVEIWREADGSVSIAYRMFSGLDKDLPPLGDDPLRGLREQAHALADPDKSDQNMQRPLEPLDPRPEGESDDREGVWRKTR